MAQKIAPGESIQNGQVEIKADAATHRGNRYAVDRWRSSANMYLFATNNLSCFFAGDTALTPESTHLVERHVGAAGRRLDLALLPIGHAPWWKPGFRKGHLTSGDALTLFDRLDARYLIPYHWGTFDHVTSKAHDAIRRLRAQLPAHPRSETVQILEPGMSFELPIPEQ
jgi:L-ascorbate metabolism protein UlaG (beta-lactamase superfamily)